MLIRFFRSSFAVQYLVVLLIALVMWLPAFLMPPAIVLIPDGSGLLFVLLAEWLNEFTFVAVLVSFLMVLLLSFYFNEVLASNLLIARNSFTGALSWVLLFSFSPQIIGFSPMIPAALFVLAALHMLFLIYDNRDAVFYVFNGSFFIALAGLFYPAAFALIVWYLLGLVIALQFDWRNLGAAFLGFITPVYFVWSWFFITDELAVFYQVFEFSMGVPEFIFFSMFSLTEWIVFVFFVLIVIAAVNFVWTGESERNLGLRKKISMTNLLFLVTLFLFFWKPAQLHALVLIPLAVYLAYDLAFNNKLRLRTIFLYCMLIAMGINHYFQLLPDGIKSIF